VDKRTASPRTAPPTSPLPTSEPTGSAPASEAATTTSAPRRPTPDDVALLAVAQSLELTARDVYRAALDAGIAESDVADVFTTLARNHSEYANRLSGILGVDAPQQRDDELFEQLIGSFETDDVEAVAEAGLDLESTLLATHNELISQLTGIDGLTALASFVVVEARHCTVLADVAGRGDDLDAMLTSDAQPLALPSAASGWRHG
jgi:Ferritin-like domain